MVTRYRHIPTMGHAPPPPPPKLSPHELDLVVASMYCASDPAVKHPERLAGDHGRLQVAVDRLQPGTSPGAHRDIQPLVNACIAYLENPRLEGGRAAMDEAREQFIAARKPLAPTPAKPLAPTPALAQLRLPYRDDDDRDFE